MLELTPLTLGLGVLLVGVALVYIFHGQIAKINYIALRLLFAVLLVICASSVFTPFVYQVVAEQSLVLSQSDVRLKELDKTIDNVNNAVANVSNGLGSIFGNPSQKPAPSNIYQQTLSLTTGIIRWTVFAVSFILLIVVTYLHYGLAGVVKSRELQHRVERLEHIVLQQPAA